jgi:tetratricopeptide (TPR) repeat protein
VKPISINNVVPGHPSVAVTLNALANVYRDQERYAEAEPTYRRALRVRESTLEADDSAIVETLTDLAKMLRKMGRVAEAERLEAQVGT